MITTLSRRPRRAASVALAGMALLPLAGCGGDEAVSGASGDGLARLAPATSPFYAEAAIRPEGDLKADVDALIAKFAPGQNADELLTQAFSSATGDVDYTRDIKPWLGERAAVTVTGLPAGAKQTPDAAALIEVTDADKALATLRKDSAGDKVEDREYNGTKYLQDDETSGGIVDDTLVIGTEPAFKAVVDASKGDGLASAAQYTKATAPVVENTVGFVYADVRRAFDLLKTAGQNSVDAQQLESVRELLDRQEIKTFAAGLAVTDTAMKFKVAANMKDNGQGDAAAATLAALPAGSWAAFGLGDLGKGLSDGLDSLRALSGPGFDLQSGLDQLEQQAGIDVQKDLISWMGQTGLFVRGTSLTDIGGALVVQSKDPGATRAALAKARTLAAGAGLPAQDLAGSGIDDGFSVRPPGSPVEVFAALAGERFVLALNRTALDEAIAPARKLEDDDAFKAAAQQLGDGLKPSFFFDFPKVAGLIGAAAGGQPGYAEAKPYLDKIGTIVAGSKREGELQLQTLSVGVR